MSLRLIRFVVIMLAALSLGVGIGHLMELPARMAWDQDLWVGATVQGGFYALSGPLGVLLQVFTIIALIVLARSASPPWRRRRALHHRRRGHVRHRPPRLVDLRLSGECRARQMGERAGARTTGRIGGRLWEWGQAANGLAQLAGFAALIASVLVTEGQEGQDEAKRPLGSLAHPLSRHLSQIHSNCRLRAPPMACVRGALAIALC